MDCATVARDGKVAVVLWARVSAGAVEKTGWADRASVWDLAAGFEPVFLKKSRENLKALKPQVMKAEQRQNSVKRFELVKVIRWRAVVYSGCQIKNPKWSYPLIDVGRWALDVRCSFIREIGTDL